MVTRAFNAISVLTSVALLFIAFARLDYHAGELLTWECETLDHLQDWLRTFPSPMAYLFNSLLWDDAVLSGSHSSVWFGAPVALLAYSGLTSLWWYRLPALLAGVLACTLFSHFISLRHKSVSRALFFLVMLSHPTLLYYSCYGVSGASTILASTLCIFACFFASKKPSLGKGAALGVLLSLCTLNYAPTRLMVIGCLLWFLATVMLSNQLALKKVGGCATCLLIIGLFVCFQWHNDRLSKFLNARGEQALTDPHSSSFSAHFGFATSKLQLAKELGLKRLPEFFAILNPITVSTPPLFDARQTSDPPRLQYLNIVSALFLIIGLIHLVALKDYRMLSLVLVTLGVACAPLLLTTRVDAHRLLPIVPVLLIVIVEGVASSARVGKWLPHLFLFCVAATQLFYTIHQQYPRSDFREDVKTVMAFAARAPRDRPLSVYGPGYCFPQYAAAPGVLERIIRGQAESKVVSTDPGSQLSACMKELTSSSDTKIFFDVPRELAEEARVKYPQAVVSPLEDPNRFIVLLNG